MVNILDVVRSGLMKGKRVLVSESSESGSV